MSEENKSINIDLPLIGSDRQKILNKLNEENLKKPAQYPPIVEGIVKKKLGYNFSDIESIAKDLFYYSKNYRSIRKNTTVQDLIRHSQINLYKKFKNKTDYVPNNYKEAFDKLEKYIVEYKSIPKIKTYHENHYLYNKRLAELTKEYTFTGSLYDNPGYLLTLENKRTGRIFTFLIGTRQYIKNSFGSDSYNIRVLRAKKVISDEEIEGMQLFE